MTPKAIALIVGLISSIAGVTTPRAAAVELVRGDSVTITSVELDAISADLERLAEARTALSVGQDVYASQGLELPEIHLVVHPSLAECGGRVGRYDERTNELWLCRIDDEAILHELAHAWIDLNVSDSTRAAFVDLRGLDAWNDRTQPWAERGSEQAAEILVWALSDHDRTVAWTEDGVHSHRLLSIDQSSPEELRAGYRLLVGSEPLRRVEAAEESSSFSPEAARGAATQDEPFSPEALRR